MNEKKQTEETEPEEGRPAREMGKTDPTALTTQRLLREVSLSREIIETRLAGNDKAIELLQKTTDRTSELVNAAVARLQELHDEKFESIQTQFKERDTRTEQTSKDGKVAIDAALQAQKEAVSKQNDSNSAAIAKSEAGFTKQIDGLILLLNQTVKATDEKITDLKNLATLIQSQVTTIQSHSKGLGDGWGYLIGLIGTLVAIGTLLAVVLKKP